MRNSVVVYLTGKQQQLDSPVQYNTLFRVLKIMRQCIENVLGYQSCSDGLKLEKVIKESSVKHIEHIIYSTVLMIVCQKCN